MKRQLLYPLLLFVLGVAIGFEIIALFTVQMIPFFIGIGLGFFASEGLVRLHRDKWL